MNSGRFNNRAKCFFIIKSFLLIEAFGYKADLVAVNGAISFSFYFEDPLASHNIHLKCCWNQRPCLIPYEGIIFILHGSLPVIIFGSLGETRLFKGHGIRVSSRESMRQWVQVGWGV